MYLAFLALTLSSALAVDPDLDLLEGCPAAHAYYSDECDSGIDTWVCAQLVDPDEHPAFVIATCVGDTDGSEVTAIGESYNDLWWRKWREQILECWSCRDAANYMNEVCVRLGEFVHQFECREDPVTGCIDELKTRCTNPFTIEEGTILNPDDWLQ